MSHPKIALRPVSSSQIEAIGHDPETNTLAIKFARGGSLYHYRNFGADAFKSLIESDSVGSYFYKHIKADPDAFPFTRINEEEEQA